MNRTQRLLDLIQILRGYRYPVRGEKLAERLGISIRTLYRDIATLQAQGAEILGEPGVGYVLRPGFFMPPLMFSETEVEALMLGMHWVSYFADHSLSHAADAAIAKIREVLPKNLKDGMGAVPLRVGPPVSEKMREEDLSTLRKAIREERKIEIEYCSEKKEISIRTVWPFAIGYFSEGRILAAWCETRKDFRHFRTDRILSLNIFDQRYPRRREILYKEWKSQLDKKTTPK